MIAHCGYYGQKRQDVTCTCQHGCPMCNGFPREYPVVYLEPKPPEDDDSEPYEPFPTIKRDWLVNRRWLFDQRPIGTRKQPQAIRRILRKPRRRFHLSVIQRAIKQMRAKHGRTNGSL